MIADDWALVMARRPDRPFDARDAELIAARAELERERAKRVETERKLALFDPVTERRLDAQRS